MNLLDAISSRQELLLDRQLAAKTGQVPVVSHARRTSRILPDFLIIGAAKSATSSLMRTLEAHPQISKVRIKEPDYFAVDRISKLGPGWYESLFEDIDTDAKCGEASTAYTRMPYHKGVVDRVAQANPDVRVVYLVRDPVGRSYSHMLHRWYKELFVDEPFDVDPIDFLKTDPIILPSSRYFYQIQAWREKFGDDRIHVMAYETLLENPKAELDRLCQFLKIDTGVLQELATENVTSNFLNNRLNYSLLKKAKEQFPRVASAAKALPSPMRNVLTGAMGRASAACYKQRFTPPALDDRLVDFLRAELEDDARALCDAYQFEYKLWPRTIRAVNADVCE